MLEIAILSAASSCREAKLLQVGDAVEVNESPGDHQDVEQLMGVKLRRERRTKTAGYKNHGEEFLIQALFPYRRQTLTQMSHLPGKNLSGIRAAYRQAPVM